MKAVTFNRIIKNGLINYQRNFWLSTAATIVMVVTLFIMTSLLILHALTSLSLEIIQDKVDISVYFHLTTQEQTIRQIQSQVELLPEVEEVTYIPPVQARERFRELHKDEPLLLESLEQFDEGENPFPASFAIRVRSLEDYPTIIALFSDPKFEGFVKRITDKRDIVDRLNQITKGIRNLGLGLVLIFSAVTVIVMFNTIRLTIYGRKEEIEIMRLVGASNSYIRGPFMVEGILYGASGAVIASAVLLPLLLTLSPRISRFLELPATSFEVFGLNLWLLLSLQLLVGVLLGVVSSLIAIRRYLQV